VQSFWTTGKSSIATPLLAGPAPRLQPQGGPRAGATAEDPLSAAVSCLFSQARHTGLQPGTFSKYLRELQSVFRSTHVFLRTLFVRRRASRRGAHTCHLFAYLFLFRTEVSPPISVRSSTQIRLNLLQPCNTGNPETAKKGKE